MYIYTIWRLIVWWHCIYFCWINCHWLFLSLALMSRNIIHIWRSIEEKKKRDEAPMKRIITTFGDFSLSLSLSSRIQIIYVWMTRVLHHLLDIKMRPVVSVSISRMNGQLYVTGARRHIHMYIYIKNIWWMMESEMSAQIFKSNTNAWWQEERWLFQARKKMKSTNQTGRRKRREVFLIYEPSLRFRGNKSDTTCLQTLKCHRSIAQLTPLGQ
jgi:hypothetical protein